MHNIDIHNYEAYLLDFSEGNLTDELQMELELFLIQHPELEINLDELSLVTLEKEAASFSNKTSLKKSETDLVSEIQFIAYIENQLPENERLALEKSCAINASLSKELELFARTLATPDTSIVFENKQSLKRKSKVIWFNFSVTQYAAAACVLFLIGLFMLWPKTNDDATSTLANKATPVKTDVQPFANSNNIQSSIETTPVHKESIKTIAQKSSLNKTQQKQLTVNHTTIGHQLNTIAGTNDSIIKSIHNLPIVQSPKNEVLVAQNVIPANTKQQTVVQVISENDDELLASKEPVKKKGIWAAASRALKNLNHVGVKGVDGDEETNKDNTAYAITLGGVSITHKAGL